MASADLERIRNYKTEIKSVACEKEIEPAVIAAIISRDSRGHMQVGNMLFYLHPLSRAAHYNIITVLFIPLHYHLCR